MSGHWVAPPVQGTSAASDMRTFIERTHAERAAEVHANARRPLREPLVRAVVVRASDMRTPRDARAFATNAAGYGWSVRITYAHGWMPDKNGDEETTPIMEPTGEILDSGRKQMHKVGEKEKPPMHSIRVVLKDLDSSNLLIAGYWLDGVFDFSLVLDENGLRKTSLAAMRKAAMDHAPGAAHLF